VSFAGTGEPDVPDLPALRAGYLARARRRLGGAPIAGGEGR
jgi:hypothetical protein